jgi:D-3-phosphoglycerate dehydrogenase
MLAATRDADAVLVQFAQVPASVIEGLARCKVIVRYGIGYDNVDIATAKRRGIPVCNVPDYGVQEVADHAVSMALALGRQLPALDRHVRSGQFTMGPITPMPAFREMAFITLGFGRIARAVLQRAKGFGFKLAAYDPLVPAAAFEEAGVEKLNLDEAFSRADVLSLHSPLTDATRHVVNEVRLRQMRPTAILVNSARGALVDTVALAAALRQRTIAYAALDVFEAEPLPGDHPLRQCDNLILTPHMAWYSEASLPRLQTLAAEEVVRALRGEPLNNQLNA